MENEKMNAFLHFPNESLEKCSGTIIKGQNLESLQILSIAIFGKFIIFSFFERYFVDKIGEPSKFLADKLANFPKYSGAKNKISNFDRTKNENENAKIEYSSTHGNREMRGLFAFAPPLWFSNKHWLFLSCS